MFQPPELSGNLKFRTSPPCRQKTGVTNKDRRETSILIMGHEDCHNYTQEIVFGSPKERVKQRSRRRWHRSLLQLTRKTEHSGGTDSTSFVCQVQRGPTQLKRTKRVNRTNRVNRTKRVHHPGCEEATVLRDRPSGLTRVGQTELTQSRNSLCDLLSVCMFGVCPKRGDVVVCIRCICHRCVCCAHMQCDVYNVCTSCIIVLLSHYRLSPRGGRYYRTVLCVSNQDYLITIESQTAIRQHNAATPLVGSSHLDTDCVRVTHVTLLNTINTCNIGTEHSGMEYAIRDICIAQCIYIPML